jgi:hypothetical protein
MDSPHIFGARHASLDNVLGHLYGPEDGKNF